MSERNESPPTQFMEPAIGEVPKESEGRRVAAILGALAVLVGVVFLAVIVWFAFQ